MKRHILILSFLLLVACPRTDGLETTPQSQAETLVILHTNDTHGYIWGTDETGTAAQRATVIEQSRTEIEAAGGAVIVLDAGDVRTGTYCSDEQQAEPDLEIMELIGYDAMVVGNHEFDEHYTTTLEQRNLVDFPLLGANVVSSETMEPIFDSTLILERAGLEIGIIGLVTAESATTSSQGADPDIRFVDPIETARRLLPTLRDRVDVLIILSHLGLTMDRRLAQEVSGIDIIIGGHSHDALEHPIRVGDTMIAQAGSYQQYVGRVEVSLNHGEIEAITGRLLPVTTSLPAVPGVSALLERYACEEETVVIAELPRAITREPLEGLGTSSALSNFVADAFREVADTDIGIMNRGGLRADLDAGPITAADIHAVLPFDNHLVVIEASGRELEAIARSVRSRGRDGRGILFTSGMRFVFGPNDQTSVFIDDAPPDPERLYTIAISAFIAEGGDRHEAIAELGRVRELELTTSQALTVYLQNLESIEIDEQSRTEWVSSVTSLLLPFSQAISRPASRIAAL